jgi:S1-C subfamily serine protease
MVAVVLAWGAANAAGGETEPLEQRLVRLFADNAAAVVRVKVAAESTDADVKPTVLVDTGFFISREGRVLTTFRTSARPSRIWVEKDGVESLAELVGADSRTNIGLLQVRKLPEHFGVIPVEVPEEPNPAGSPNVDGRLPIGSLVVSISNPLELDVTPTLGLVAGFESFFSEEHQFPFTYMRVSVPVGRGESGSPVLDMQGHLAGIAIASVAGSRWSYLVPARALARIVQDLSKDGRVNYGALPVDFGEFPDQANVTRRVIVSRVVPESSAARAGLRAGDVVRKLGAVPVHRIHDVRDALFFARPGEFIQMEVEREGRGIALALTVEAAPEPPVKQPPEGDPSGEVLHPPSSP